VRAVLDAAGQPYRINPRLVRGMDYYNLTVFEWVTDRSGAQGTVCGGGRYDGLIELIGGKPAPAIGWGMGIERVLDCCSRKACAAGASARRLCRAARCRPLPQAMVVREPCAPPACQRGADARRGQGRAWGSMKSQFKKADASGARHALVFGADELARARSPSSRCATPPPPRSNRALADVPAWAPNCSPHNRGLFRLPTGASWPHNSTCKSRNNSTPQGVLEAVRQPDHLGDHPGAGRLCRLERLELVAARPGHARPAPCSTNSNAPRIAGDADKAGRVFADLKERFPRTAWPSRAGLLRPRCSSTRARPMPPRPAWPGWREGQPKTSTAPSPACAWPPAADAKQYDEALKALDAAKAKAFEALVADRRGDVLLAQGKPTRPAPPTRRPTRPWTTRSTTAAWSRPSSPRWARRRHRPHPALPRGPPVTAAHCRSGLRVLLLAACAADKPKPTAGKL
jgi:hypothetical protein